MLQHFGVDRRAKEADLDDVSTKIDAAASKSASLKKQAPVFQCSKGAYPKEPGRHSSRAQ